MDLNYICIVDSFNGRKATASNPRPPLHALYECMWARGCYIYLQGCISHGSHGSQMMCKSRAKYIRRYTETIARSLEETVGFHPLPHFRLPIPQELYQINAL